MKPVNFVLSGLSRKELQSPFNNTLVFYSVLYQVPNIIIIIIIIIIKIITIIIIINN